MTQYKIKITTLSPLHLGSGRADVVIDAEVVHDKYGLPYFPAKRFKGLLYESALEMAEISNDEWFTTDDVKKLFGQKNAEISGFFIENFYLDNYGSIEQSWEYLNSKYPNIFTREAVLESYTDIRYMTSIEEKTGTTKDGSLHNMRVVDIGTVFKGSIVLNDDTDNESSLKNKRIIEYALKNLRFAGAKRTRGCGAIKCEFNSALKSVAKDKKSTAKQKQKGNVYKKPVYKKNKGKRT